MKKLLATLAVAPLALTACSTTTVPGSGGSDTQTTTADYSWLKDVTKFEDTTKNVPSYIKDPSVAPSARDMMPGVNELDQRFLGDDSYTLTNGSTTDLKPEADIYDNAKSSINFLAINSKINAMAFNWTYTNWAKLKTTATVINKKTDFITLNELKLNKEGTNATGTTICMNADLDVELSAVELNATAEICATKKGTEVDISSDLEINIDVPTAPVAFKIAKKLGLTKVQYKFAATYDTTAHKVSRSFTAFKLSAYEYAVEVNSNNGDNYLASYSNVKVGFSIYKKQSLIGFDNDFLYGTIKRDYPSTAFDKTTFEVASKDGTKLVDVESTSTKHQAKWYPNSWSGWKKLDYTDNGVSLSNPLGKDWVDITHSDDTTQRFIKNEDQNITGYDKVEFKNESLKYSYVDDAGEVKEQSTYYPYLLLETTDATKAFNIPSSLKIGKDSRLTSTWYNTLKTKFNAAKIGGQSLTATLKFDELA